MDKRRNKQVTQLIKRELSEIVAQHIRAEDFKLVTISALELSRNSTYIKVWISALENEEELQKHLDSKISKIQSDLNRKLHLRTVPKIILIADSGRKAIDRISKKLKDL